MFIISKFQHTSPLEFMIKIYFAMHILLLPYNQMIKKNKNFIINEKVTLKWEEKDKKE